MQISNTVQFFLLRKADEVTGEDNKLIWFKNRPAFRADWGAFDRVSPIFPVEPATFQGFDDAKARFVFLLGPIYPPNLPALGYQFLTSGLFNCVVVLESEEDKNKLEKFLQGRALAWERWDLNGPSVENVSVSTVSSALNSKLRKVAPIQRASLEVRNAVDEYNAIIQTVTQSCSVNEPKQYSDLSTFNDMFIKIIASDLDHVTKHGMLSVANAALSRYYSQTYSGKGQTFYGDYYYQYHSLFGVGIVTKAMSNIRRHIQKEFAGGAFFERLRCFRQMDPANRPIVTLQSDREADKAELHTINIDSISNSQLEVISGGAVLPLLPLVASISTRDGFRSTALSVSAPREVISCCSSAMWTLYTLTHELSHSFIGGVLAFFLPDLLTREGKEEAARLLGHLNSAGNMHESLTSYLLFGFYQLTDRFVEESLRNSEGSTETIGYKPDEVALMIKRYNAEANEVMTHAFDYLYFYRGNPDAYVKSLWASWAGIPNIENRIDEYLMRTLAAIHTENLEYLTEGIGQTKYACTVDTLAICLENIKPNSLNHELISLAQKALASNKKFFEHEVQRIEELVKFVRYVLYSKAIATNMHRGEVMKVRVRAFDEKVPDNILLVLSEYCFGSEPCEKKSAWILQNLAFVR